MSDTTSSSDQDAQKHWKPWIQDWRFLNTSEFRIPGYLSSLTRDWCQESPLLRRLLSKPTFTLEPVYFFRHPLTDERKGNVAKTSQSIQFTQSAILTDLLTRPNQNCAADAFAKSFEELFKIITGKREAWIKFIENIEKQPGSNLSHINFRLLESIPDLTQTTTEGLPGLFHHIFLAFCHISHDGYLQKHLNQYHLNYLNDLPKRKCPNEILGYFLELEKVDKKPLPNIKWIRAVMDNQNLSDPFDVDTPQYALTEIFGETATLEAEKLLLDLFKAVNGDIVSDRDRHYMIAVPVYEWSSPPITNLGGYFQRHRAGAFLGWMLNRFPKDIDPASFDWNQLQWPKRSLEPESCLYEHIRSLSFLAEGFASKYLSGETEWALERKWEPGDDALLYMAHNFFHSCGRVCSFDHKDVDPEEIECVKGKYFHRVSKGEIRPLLVNLSKCFAPRQQPGSTSSPVIAVLYPGNLCQEPVEAAEDELHAYEAEHARYFYGDRCLPRQVEREATRLKGVLESQHDYSKDLNSNDIRMDRYERHVKQEREKLQTLIENTSALEIIDTSDRAKSSVVEGLKEVHREYGVPLLDLMALTRYQMMRQKAKDASSLYEEPQFCVERLIDGTKNDVVRVVNLLVWMRSPEWVDPARAPQENGRDFAAWGRIFAYETFASNHLSRIAEHLFHQLGFQLEELDHYFPRPLLRCLVPQDGGEREPALTDPFLWPLHEGNTVRPHLFGFFPLFVEAMRAAYLHAYAATLDRVLALGRKQDVPQRAVAVQHPFQQFITLRPTWRLEADGRVRDYRLKISFSGPPSLAAPSSATLPLGDWHSEAACFQKLVSQWKASEATEFIAGQQAPAFSITIASH